MREQFELPLASFRVKRGDLSVAGSEDRLQIGRRVSDGAAQWIKWEDVDVVSHDTPDDPRKMQAEPHPDDSQDGEQSGATISVGIS